MSNFQHPMPNGLAPGALLNIRRVIEEARQLDAAVTELRELCGAAVSRIQIGRRVIGWKDDQRIEEFDQRQLVKPRKARELIARFSRLAAVSQDHFHQIRTPPCLAVR